MSAKEFAGLILLFVFIAGLCFLFEGEPDLWDKLHDRAMQAASCESKA